MALGGREIPKVEARSHSPARVSDESPLVGSSSLCTWRCSCRSDLSSPVVHDEWYTKPSSEAAAISWALFMLHIFGGDEAIEWAEKAGRSSGKNTPSDPKDIVRLLCPMLPHVVHWLKTTVVHACHCPRAPNTPKFSKKTRSLCEIGGLPFIGIEECPPRDDVYPVEGLGGFDPEIITLTGLFPPVQNDETLSTSAVMDVVNYIANLLWEEYR